MLFPNLMMRFSKRKLSEIAASILEEITFLKREAVCETLMMKLKFKGKYKQNWRLLKPREIKLLKNSNLNTRNTLMVKRQI